MAWRLDTLKLVSYSERLDRLERPICPEPMLIPPSSRRRARRGIHLSCALLLAFLFATAFPHGLSLWDHSPAKAEVPQTDQSGPAAEASPQSVIERAKTLIDAHEVDEAVDLLNKFIASSPTEYLDHAYLLMAAALSGRNEHAEAISYLDQLLNEFPTSDLVGRARLKLGAEYARLGNLDAALPVLAEARSLSPDGETQREALTLIGDIHTRKGDFVRAIQAWLDEVTLAPKEQRAEIHERIQSLVQVKMDKKDLLRLRDIYPTVFPGDVALIRLIELHTARGEEHLAERNIRIFLNRFPTHAYAPTATDTLRSFKERLKASQHVIAAVLPLSGRMAPFGTDSLNGIRLALERAKETLGPNSVGLLVKDSVTDRTLLRSQLADIVSEYQPLAVVGPLLSRDLQAVAGFAEQAEIPFITPAATLPDVRRYGSFLFSTALTYPLQIHRIADFAVTQGGHHRFCVLYPDTPYGQDLARLFIAEVRLLGGEVIAVESYKETDTDYGPQIKRLKAEDLKRHGRTHAVKIGKGVTRVLYRPGFDAIFLPGDYTQIALISAQLAFYDVNVPLLGSNGWNSPELLRLADRWVEGGVFVDGFFLDSRDANVQDFVERYRRRYQSNPSLFSALAYDAAWLVLDAIVKGATSGKEIRDHLLKLQEVPTLGGPAEFGPGGVLRRPVFLIQVKHGQFVQLD